MDAVSLERNDYVNLRAEGIDVERFDRRFDSRPAIRESNDAERDGGGGWDE
ncbi:hypothetical protein [Haladaptatus pallidirubidus]|uniref:Uncharacterized protein n=1 Tax=Haladaptatus pallidirubidus TaxID=1008152 RepID=A0AAV3UKA1_9EURY|nr:hypothetical protein [Haladaptatus pallidirubidus]